MVQDPRSGAARLRWLESLGAIDPRDAPLDALREEHISVESVRQIRDFLAGAPDAELERQRRLGVPIEALIGSHESVFALLRLTVEACLERDLRRARVVPAERDAWAEELARAAGPSAVARAQGRLLESPQLRQLRWIARVFEPEALAAMRGAWLRRLSARLGPACAVERSVVGWVQRACAGAELGELIDWREEQRLAAGERGDVVRSLAGVDVPLGVLEQLAREPSFCVMDLRIERVNEPVAALAPTPEAPRATLPPRDEPLFGVDLHLRLLADAILGGEAPAGWLPALPLAPCAGEIAGLRAALEQAPDGLVGLMSDRALAAAVGLGQALAKRGDFALFRGLGSGAADRARLVCALALWRWRQGFLAILAHAEPARRDRARFRRFLRSWFGVPVPRPLVRGRVRKPKDGLAEPGLIYNHFGLDLVERVGDIALTGVLWSFPSSVEGTLTWIVNNCPAMREDLIATARAAGWSGPSSYSAVWVVEGLLHPERMQEGVSDGFKQQAARSGHFFWSTAEVDEAALREQPSSSDARRWWERAGRAVEALPPTPWEAGRVWIPAQDGRLRRDLGWLRAIFARLRGVAA